MNLLILSGGRRNQLVLYFKDEFAGFGNIIVADNDPLAPALYFGDKGYVVPLITDSEYIEEIKKLCFKENIKGIISLIDPELSYLSKYKEDFLALGILCFVSESEAVAICYNKLKMFEFLTLNNFRTPKTYATFSTFKSGFLNNEIQFPIMLKPILGSASLDVCKINTMDEVLFLMYQNDDLIIQEFLNGIELGVDCYVDMINNKPVVSFVKQKIRLRSGETDKSKSVIDDVLISLIEDLVVKLKVIGPIDIDVFYVDGVYYILEVNPRFGGGYVHAHECGINFPKYIKNNLLGIANRKETNTYLADIFMMKSDQVIVKAAHELVAGNTILTK
jgi:carbamoyl-phosphate synthase large subunit